MRQQSRDAHAPLPAPGSFMSWADCAAARSVKIRRIRRVKCCGTRRASFRSAGRCSPLCTHRMQRYVAEARCVANLAASSRLPNGALRSSGRLVSFTLKSLRCRDTIGPLHLVFRKLRLGFLVFLRGSVACGAEPLSLPVPGELKIHTSGDTPCRYDTPQISSFYNRIKSLQ